MFLELLFWLLIAFSFIFGFGYATGKPWAASYGFFPVIVLIIILGIKVFGLGSLTH